MRVFVTGATGFIGSAIVKELLGAGHQVLGLARSDEGAKSVAAAGAEVQRGSLEDLQSLQSGAAAADAVIHCAFIHDFSDFAASALKDQAAIEAMTATLAGSNKPLIATSGCIGMRTEEDSPPHAFPRKSEQTVLAAVSQGVRGMVIRLAPSVHGDGDHGFVPALIQSARAKGRAIYVGDGQNLWPAVHRLDAAVLYRLAMEKGAAGARFHGAADEGIPTRQLAEVIARRLNVPAVSVTAEQATEELGFIGRVLGMGGPTSSALTQERLGWRPTHPGLLQDLEEGTYFDR